MVHPTKFFISSRPSALNRPIRKQTVAPGAPTLPKEPVTTPRAAPLLEDRTLNLTSWPKPPTGNRNKSPAGRSSRPSSLRGRDRYLRIVLHTSIALILLGSIAWLVTKLKTAMAAHVENAIPAVVFTDKPAWMTDLVASHLAESFRPAKAPALFDREALVDVNRRLKANPWVAEVRQVRRVYDAAAGDTIEVDCTFREPAALVHEPGVDRYWFVDRQGVLLPEHFESSELSKIIYAAGKVNMRIVDGVLGPPPVAAGQTVDGRRPAGRAGSGRAIGGFALCGRCDLDRCDQLRRSGHAGQRASGADDEIPDAGSFGPTMGSPAMRLSR